VPNPSELARQEPNTWDQFAAAALQGILANPAWNLGALMSLAVKDGEEGVRLAAGLAAHYADAMIKARTKHIWGR
jgi:hypothetical protein